MNRKILFFTIIFFSAAVLFAETVSLKDVSVSLSKNKITDGKFFLAKTSPKTTREMKSEGRFVISSEYGIIWFTEKPVKNAQAFTKKTIINENSKGVRSEVNFSKNTTFSEMANFTSALFTGNYAVLEERCDVEFSAEKNLWYLKLTPKDETLKLVMKGILVEGSFEKNTAFVTRLMMEQQDDSCADYHLEDQSFRENLSDYEKSFFE